MWRIVLIISIVPFLNSSSFSQSEAVIEQYHYVGKGMAYVYMPVAHFQSSSNWYAEARYNYEDIQTFSFYLGKSFSGNDNFSYKFTPLVGAAMGRFQGLSTGLNVDLEYNKFFFSAQSQYSMATERGKGSDDFFYHWSEAGYQPLEWFYAGASFQHTRSMYEKKMEPGMVIGFEFSRFSIPVYAFNGYFIVGLTVSWQGKQKAGSNKETKPIGF